MKTKLLGNIYNVGTGFAGNVFDKDFLAPTLMNMQGETVRKLGRMDI